jgi:hypothetical protein
MLLELRWEDSSQGPETGRARASRVDMRSRTLEHPAGASGQRRFTENSDRAHARPSPKAPPEHVVAQAIAARYWRNLLSGVILGVTCKVHQPIAGRRTRRIEQARGMVARLGGTLTLLGGEWS